MKYFIIIFCLAIIFSCAKENDIGLVGRVEKDKVLEAKCRSVNAYLYSDYDVIYDDCLLPLYHEDFSSSSGWYEGTQSGVDIDVRAGKYHCVGSDNVNFYLSCWDCVGLVPENFQLQMEIKMIAYDNSCTLNWGSQDTDNIYDNVYRFGLGNDGHFIIAHSKNGETQPNLAGFSASPAIDKFGVNLLTIRKVDSWHFFFINEILVHQDQNIQTYGPYLSIRIGKGAECEIDNIGILEILR